MNSREHDSVLGHWNALAARYDEAKGRNAAYYRLLQETIASAVPRTARSRVLEVGCGTGQVLASLQPGEGLGIDLSEPMIRRARERFADRTELRFEVIDAREAGGLERFTAVVSSDLLEHVPEWRAVVQSIVRAAAPGGAIAVATPNPLWAPALWLLEKLRLKMPEGPHRFVPAREVAKVLERAGCRDVRRGTHAMVPANLLGLGPRFSRLAAKLPLLSRLGVIQVVSATAP